MNKFTNKPKNERATTGEDIKGIAYIPYYCSNLINKIMRVLAEHGIKTFIKPPDKIQHTLRSVKDNLGLSHVGVYRIPCECGKHCIGQIGRSIGEGCREYQRCIRFNQSKNQD